MTVNILTYLGLTLLSIVIQFTVMELTQNDLELDTDNLNQTFDLNVTTSQKRKLEDVLNYINKKPHALYYRTHESGAKERAILPPARIYSNTSLPKISLETSTDMSTTVVDELYEEDTSVAVTTDVAYATTEIDNVTEISFFDKKNQTTIKPNITPKIPNNKDCECNLLYQACDINCCCDSDCSEADVKMFADCDGEARAGASDIDDEYFCYSHAPNTYWQHKSKFAGNLFCIVKNNLPAKRNIQNVKYDLGAVDKSFKWHKDTKYKYANEFTRKPYTYGDHVWVLKNGSIRYIDLPSPILNDYCMGRKSLIFLKDEKIICTVKLKDLEMFQILKASEDATLVSVVSANFSSSDLNCSTLYCTNWTFIACNGVVCVDYNKSVHEPSCTESYCTNLALKVDYIFYYYDSKILNATIKLHIHKVSTALTFMMQEINVKFMITNGSIEGIVQTSGSPGYVIGLPVIVSFAQGNHTQNFFNNTSMKRKYIPYLNNENGICNLSNITNNYVTFQSNKRLKCRFQYANYSRIVNETDMCNNINNNIKELFELNAKVVVSPYGNPLNIKDEEWLPLHNDLLDKEPVYGEYNEGRTKLHCFNMITRKSLIFTFAHTNGKVDKQKILNAKIELSTQNVTFIVEDISTVLTIDTMFVDQSRPSMYEYAAGPHLNIHLPKDFFFPFLQNSSNKCNYVSHIIIYCCVFVYQQIK